jgi:hypothetical protein
VFKAFGDSPSVMHAIAAKISQAIPTLRSDLGTPVWFPDFVKKNPMDATRTTMRSNVTTARSVGNDKK